MYASFMHHFKSWQRTESPISWKMDCLGNAVALGIPSSTKTSINANILQPLLTRPFFQTVPAPLQAPAAASVRAGDRPPAAGGLESARAGHRRAHRRHVHGAERPASGVQRAHHGSDVSTPSCAGLDVATSVEMSYVSRWMWRKRFQCTIRSR